MHHQNGTSKTQNPTKHTSTTHKGTQIGTTLVHHNLKQQKKSTQQSLQHFYIHIPQCNRQSSEHAYGTNLLSCPILNHCTYIQNQISVRFNRNISTTHVITQFPNAPTCGTTYNIKLNNDHCYEIMHNLKCHWKSTSFEHKDSNKEMVSCLNRIWIITHGIWSPQPIFSLKAHILSEFYPYYLLSNHINFLFCEELVISITAWHDKVSTLWNLKIYKLSVYCVV